MDDVVEYMKHTFTRLTELPEWKTLLGVFLAVGNFLFGDMRPALLAILVLFCMDFLTGFAYAIMRKNIESKSLVRGAIKLTIYGNLLIVANMFSQAELIGIGIVIASVIDSYIMITEAVSVVENLDKIACLWGVELPWLRTLIKYLRRKIDDQSKMLKRQENDGGDESDIESDRRGDTP